MIANSSIFSVAEKIALWPGASESGFHRVRGYTCVGVLVGSAKACRAMAAQPRLWNVTNSFLPSLNGVMAL